MYSVVISKIYLYLQQMGLISREVRQRHYKATVWSPIKVSQIVREIFRYIGVITCYGCIAGD